MVSNTVTVAVPVLLLPALSVTVKVTELAPIFEQVKLVVFIAKLAMPETSLLPLFTCEAVKVPVPAAFKYKVRFWVTTVGLVLSMV